METLSQLGIKSSSTMGMQVIRYSPPDAEHNARVYSRVNEILEAEIKQAGLDCTHITGEMRALADPHHRRVVRDNFRSHMKRVDLVCYLPLKHREKAWRIWRWNRKNWGTAPWEDLLDAYDLLAEGEVRLFALAKRESIHYSVFFDNFVLLQSQHMPPSHMKHVWLIESVQLTEILREKAKRIVARAERIPPSVFRGLYLSLSSPAALDSLFTLRDGGRLRGAMHAHPKGRRQGILEDLIGVGFVRETKSALAITREGLEYLTLWSA